LQSGEALWGTRSDGAEILASLVETGTIGPSTIFRIIKLNRVVFPQADFADQVGAWRLFVQREIPTARTRIAVHIDIVGHRKEIFCDLTSSTGAE
jgi:hypothetical protein